MRKLLIFVFLVTPSFFLFSQKPEKPTASEIYHKIQKLNFLGSVLYIAAHPDDENTRLISYFSNNIHARTGYLSLTRGDGGQNLIGTEIRELLGVIRTQELLGARKIDGGKQFFTRANDFGYSKHPDETLKIWNKPEVLSDVVQVIRKFKPDIIINRFNHKNPGSTHGHHTASAMLSIEAFDLVANPTKYPNSANRFGVWQPKRLLFNTSWWFYGSKEKFEKADKSNLIKIETGVFYPSEGLSNGEIAALSRSMHKSQGFGTTGNRGTNTEFLEFLKGDFPTNKSNLFDGINTTWSRIEGGKPIGELLLKVEENFNFKDPSKMIPQLIEAYKLIKELPQSHWKTIKTNEIITIITDCAGLYLEAVTNQESSTPKGPTKVTIEAINRSNIPILLNSVTSPFIAFPTNLIATPLKKNKKYSLESIEQTFSGSKYTNPYWLNENGSLGMYQVSNQSLIGLPEEKNTFPIRFNVSIFGENISITKNCVYKTNDPVDGEIYRPFAVLPEVTARISEKVIIFSDSKQKNIPVIITAEKENVSGIISLQYPDGWNVSPKQTAFSIDKKGEEKEVVFKTIPPKNQSEGFLKPIIKIGDSIYDKELITISYKHFPTQKVLLPSKAKVVHIDLLKKGKQIGYIKGAGDLIPESLKQIGYQVNTIEISDITEEKLANYDAIVIGIRAYNTKPELAFKQKILNNYVFQGGTLLVQYNTSHRLITKDLAPYQLTLSRDRVTNEFSKVTFLAPKNPVLNTPNKITQNDFEGWVQERGLYFPNKWAKEFIPILEMKDDNNPKTKGSLLIANYGKGHYIYTGLSFFRELPAGVPGAFRLFANILSLGK
ncbi:MAG: PIG-L family deacetylase [Flavobacteriales bacterium]